MNHQDEVEWDFALWVRAEMNGRGWTGSDLARRMNSDPGTVGNVINGNRGAGPAFCIALAQALGVPREVVFRAPGWLLYTPQPLVAPNLPHPVMRMVDTVRHLPPRAQDEVLAVWARILAMACLLLGRADSTETGEGR